MKFGIIGTGNMGGLLIDVLIEKISFPLKKFIFIIEQLKRQRNIYYIILTFTSNILHLK